MFYALSVLILLTVLFLVLVLGRRLLTLAPEEVRTCAGLFLAPVLGLAALLIISAIHGRFFPFNQWLCALTAGALAGAGLVWENNRRELLRQMAILAPMTLLLSLPVLFPIFRFSVFQTETDAIHYFTIAQWLQKHAFSEPFKDSIYNAFKVVHLFQAANQRMGAQFLIGWVQGLFGLSWSIYAYPAVCALALATGGLAMGGVAALREGGARWVPYLIAITGALSTSGFVFGAHHGFLPQTLGLSFILCALALIAVAVKMSLGASLSWKTLAVVSLPPALCLSALIFSYGDILPFVVLALSVFLGLLLRRDRRATLLLAVTIGVEVILLTNVELIRTINLFINNLSTVSSGHVQIGWRIQWQLVEFLEYALGAMHYYQYFVFDQRWLSLAAVALLGAGLLYGYMRDVTASGSLSRIYHILLIIFVLAFIKYRYFVKGFDVGEMGNTYFQFKLAGWMSPILMVLLGFALGRLTELRSRWPGGILALTLAALSVNGLWAHYRIADNETLGMRAAMGHRAEPFSAMRDLRESVLAGVGKDQTIFVSLPDEHFRRLVRYFLYDRKAFSGNRQFLPEDNVIPPGYLADWLIRPAHKEVPEKNVIRVGTLELLPMPKVWMETTGYSDEAGRPLPVHDSIYWVEHALLLHFDLFGAPSGLSVAFSYMPHAHDPRLLVEITDGKGGIVWTEEVIMNGAWVNYRSPVIKAPRGPVTVTLRSEGTPLRISRADPRMASFAVQGVRVEPILQ